ncbi:MAG: DNA repair protein RecN [Kiritimatiellaeota bacterium]|nr:DNA repair protein RecN [Kiritimatiellota bacterium]
MIEKLTVRNIAVVETAEMRFGAGLTVVTGETGAGKSVLIGAISLLTGGRADHSVIRSGADKAYVGVEFSLAPGTLAQVNAILEEAGAEPCEDGLLILSREISVAGSGRCHANSRAVTAQTLRKLGEILVDMHGPHDNQSLLSPAFQLDSLDSFGRCGALRDAFAALYRERGNLIRKRDELACDSASVGFELDLLRQKIKEISDAQLNAETDGDEPPAEHANSANAARLLELGGAVAEALDEGDASAANALAVVIRQLEEMRRAGCEEAEEWVEEAESAATQINELSRSIASALSRIDASPERLEWLDRRVSLVEKLKRKYGGTVEDVLMCCETASARATDLESREEQIAEIETEIAKMDSALTAAAAKLTAARVAAVKSFSAAVSKQLADLGLPKAAFGVEISPAETDSPAGRDDLEFVFAPNVGEGKRALRHIASSGEISRVMLALKTVLAEHDKVPVMVFDEIDANIGGEIANVVGAKLRGVAGAHQVICITHLPQVAAWGQRHMAVTKRTEDGRAATQIKPVENGARTDEIARMLGGANLTSVTRKHAEEMLANCGNTAP